MVRTARPSLGVMPARRHAPFPRLNSKAPWPELKPALGLTYTKPSGGVCFGLHCLLCTIPDRRGPHDDRLRRVLSLGWAPGTLFLVFAWAEHGFWVLAGLISLCLMLLFFYLFVQDINAFGSLGAMVLSAAIYYIPIGLEEKTWARALPSTAPS